MKPAIRGDKKRPLEIVGQKGFDPPPAIRGDKKRPLEIVGQKGFDPPPAIRVQITQKRLDFEHLRC